MNALNNILNNVFSSNPNAKTIAKFTILIFFTEFVRGAYMTFLPLYTRNFLGYHNVDLAGIVIFAFFFIETLSQVWIGWILDRFNNRIVLIIGLFISFAALVVLKFISSPILLVLDAAMIGLGFAPVWIIVLGHVSTYSEEKRVSSMGIIYSAWLSGLGLGMVVISFIISRSFIYALNSLIVIWLFCALIGCFIYEGIERVHYDEFESSSFISALKEISGAKLLLPAMLLQTLSITLLIPIISIYFTGTIGLTPDQYGYIEAIIGIIAVLSLALISRITSKFKVEKTFVLGLILTAIGIYSVGHITNIPFIIVFGVIAGISYSLILPSWYTIMSNNISTTNKGLTWGIFSTLEGIGRSLGPLIGGIIGERFAFQTSFSVSALVLIGLAVFYSILNKRNLLRF